MKKSVNNSQRSNPRSWRTAKNNFVEITPANVGAKQTVPMQTPTLEKMLSNYQKGHPLIGFPNPVYNEDYDLPDLSRLDLTEIDELRAKVAAKIEKTKEDHELNRKALSIVEKKLNEKKESDLLQKIADLQKTKENPPKQA